MVKSTITLVHIYCSPLWEDKFIPLIYDICDHFMGSIYHNIFKEYSPNFSSHAKELISTMGEYFSYIIIWGSKKTHLLQKIIPDRMVLEDISFQTMIDGVFPKMYGDKRRGWTKFPLNLGSLVIHNSTHANFLGKRITNFKLGEAPKRFYNNQSIVTHI